MSAKTVVKLWSPMCSEDRTPMRVAAWLLIAIALTACVGAGAPTASPTPTIETATPSPTPTLEASATGTPSASTDQFPAGVPGQAVYDFAEVLSDDAELALEEQLDAIETEAGVSVVLYMELNPEATLSDTVAAAEALLNQWEVGGAEGNGLVILIAFDESREHGQLATFAGAELLPAFKEATQTELRDEVMIPTFRADSIEAGIVAGIDYVGDVLQ